MQKETDPSAHIPASELLRRIYDMPKRDQISIGEFVELLGDRSFALVILIFSLPNSLPMPGIPGFSTLTGLPILFIAFQLVTGREKIWLPKSVAEKKFSYDILRKVIDKSLPFILKLEKLLHPRATRICGRTGERVIGFLMLLMAAILVLPIVGGNFLPGATITLMALALLENDGVFAGICILFCLLNLHIMLSILRWAMRIAITWVTTFLAT